jgi:hypothetical protein
LKILTKLLYGSPIRLFPNTVSSKSTVPAVSDFIEKIQESIAIARDNHVAAKSKQTTYANKDRKDDPKYQVRDQVYLDTSNLRLRIKQKGRSAKFYPRYVGPYPFIKGNPETSTYKLQLHAEYRIHPTFHARRLKPAFENDHTLFPGHEVNPPPIDAEDNQ